MTKTNSFAEWLEKRSVRYILLGILTVFFLVNYSSIFDEKPDMNGDNIHYYSLGKALAEGKGFTNIMSLEESPHTHFPPGYPLFVAGVMKFFPDSLHAVKVANGVLFYLSLVLLFFLLKKLSGNILVSFLTCILCAYHSELLRYSTIAMSEILYLCCTTAVVWLTVSLDIKQVFTKKSIMPNLMLLGLIFLVNYIYFVRTMGTSIILAVIIYFGLIFSKQFYFFFKEKKNTGNSEMLKNMSIKYGLIFLILLITFTGSKKAWDIRNQNAGKTTSDYINDFKKKPGGEQMTTWEDWGDRITWNFKTYLSKWIPGAILYTDYGTEKEPTSGEMFKGICVALLIILGLIRLREGSLLLFLYLGATLGVLLVWPEQYGGLRYFIATIPFFIFLFLNGLKELLALGYKLLVKKNIPFTWQIGVVTLFILIFMFPAYTKALSYQKQMAKFKTWNAQIGGPAFAEYISAAQWCAANLPDSARMISRKPEIYYLYSNGKKSGTFSHYGKPEDVYERLVREKATHVIIDHWFRHAYTTLYPLIVQHYPEKFKPICQFGGKTSQEIPTLIFEFNPAWGYEGESVEGKRQGKGKLVMQDGRTYVGDFGNNRFNGYGELYDNKGNLIVKGIWKDDNLIKQE